MGLGSMWQRRIDGFPVAALAVVLLAATAGGSVTPGGGGGPASGDAQGGTGGGPDADGAGAAALAEVPPRARPGDVIPSRYIVTLEPGADRSAVASRARSLGARKQHGFKNVVRGFAVSMPLQAAARLERDPGVARLEPDRVVGPVQEQRPAPWGLDRIDQPSLPLSGGYIHDGDGSSVRAYVVDTGIRSTHRDFEGEVSAGYDVFGGTGQDCNGHGTHVAGTIGGRTYGVAKAVTLVPVRVLDCGGSGTWSGVIAGLDWIAQNRPAGTPAVVNMSLGGGAVTAVDDAVRRLVSLGVSVVVAAGNSNVDACAGSPARVAEAVVVGATDQTDRRAPFSNFGRCLDLFAPGAAITSAWHTSDTATAQLSGTSMAAPHVAGATALLLQRATGTTPAAVEQSLIDGATPGVVSESGTGSPDRLLHTASSAAAGPTPGVTRLTAAARLSRARLSWRTPDGVDTLVVRRTVGRTPPAGVDEGTEIFRGAGSSALARRLRAGNDYSFSVFALAGSATSEPVSYTLLGTETSLSGSRSRIPFGRQVALTGRLLQGDTGLDGQRVVVRMRPVGGTRWSRLTAATTDAYGWARLAHRPDRNTEYQLLFPGRTPYLGSAQGRARVLVRHQVSGRLSDKRISRGRSVRFTGAVRPAHAGQPVLLQQRIGGTWRRIARDRLDSSSRYAFTLRPKTRGTHVYRVLRPADAGHIAGTSGARKIRVQ